MPTRPPLRADPSPEALLRQARLAHESIHKIDSAAALARAFDAGDALRAAKAQLQHGQWSEALASTGIPPSTAQLYMQLSRERARILAAGCTSISEARRLLAGTKPRARRTTTTGRRARPVEDQHAYEKGYADGYQAGRADGFRTGQAQPRARRTGDHLPVASKDLKWLIGLAHPDRHDNDLRATRVTQWLIELRAPRTS